MRSEQGSVIVLVALSLVIVIGMLGLAMDAGQLYVTKQRAQAAADAAAQAGVMDMYNGATVPAGKCPTTGGSAACVYARLNGFGGSGSDTVTIDFPGPGAALGVTLSGSDTPNLIRAVVQRTVNTTFMRVLPLAPTSATVTATAIAAISVTPSPIPILITHPTLSGSFSKNGGNDVIICGGPARAIQVNSNSTTSVNISGNSGSIDLRHAGPKDDGTCNAGTGADFANVGAQTPFPPKGNLMLGTGTYVEPASAIRDPLADVNPPARPANAPAKTALANGVSGCPASPQKACVLYSPGTYPTGIDVKNETGVFKPGIYYVASGGFQNEANGLMLMATGFTDGVSGTNTGWTGNMLVYNAGSGTFNVGSNSAATLVGSPGNSSYKGILFFQNRTAAAASHSFGGGGALTLQGTIYINNSNPTATAYQSVTLSGHSGNDTLIQGEIITNKLTLSGSASIRMNLISTPIFSVRQVALVK